MSRTDCIANRRDASHLFVCSACRADARLSSAWRGVSISETPVAVDERFVAEVVEGLRRGRSQQERRRFWIAAAAAALFFFFAGLALERASRATAPAAEESYASLASPDTLGELIPN